MKLIGITGGIGAGKSVVSRILRLQGHEVYDCDLQAKRIMDEQSEIREAVCGRFGEECLLEDGSFDRAYIASRIFSDDVERCWLNAIIHDAVREDIRLRISMGNDFFVESAILRSSGLDKLCDEIWLVAAPESVRMERALQRGGITESGLRSRMQAQAGEFEFDSDSRVFIIDNSGKKSLLDQVCSLLVENNN